MVTALFCCVFWRKCMGIEPTPLLITPYNNIVFKGYLQKWCTFGDIFDISPAMLYNTLMQTITDTMDLNESLIKHPVSTFYLRATGDSMTGAGIYPGDLLIVDKSLEPINKTIIIAVVNGEMTVKRLRLKEGRVWLEAENEKYPPIEINERVRFEVWGVVTYSTHSV